MEERLVGYDVAKAAKWKFIEFNTRHGFNEPTKEAFDGGNVSNWSLLRKFISRPTQSVVQAYLRDNHNLKVYVVPHYDNEHYNSYILNKEVSYNKEHYDLSFKTYEDALEAGLEEALNLIEN